MMGLLDFAAKYLPEVNEWKMAKEAKLQNEERNWHGQHHITTEPLSCKSLMSTRKRPKKCIHHKRKSIARKQKASMDAHVRRITEASLSKFQPSCPINEDGNHCQCHLLHKLPNRRPPRKPVENDWNPRKHLNAQPKKETGNKILRTQDVQTIETSSISSIATRIESEIKSFKEKREDFINYLEVLQSEIKALEIPHVDTPAESRNTLSAKESSKENVDKNLKGIIKTSSEEILNPTIADISVTKLENNTTEVTNESSKEILKENKEHGPKQIAKEVSVKDKINVESNNEKKVEHFSKELVHKTDTNSSEKKEKQVEGQKEHKKPSTNKKIKSIPSEDKKSLEGSESTKMKSSEETDIKAEPKERKDEVQKVKENVKSKKLHKKGSCIRRITTITSSEIKTKLGTDYSRNPKIQPLKEEDINREVLELVIPRLRTLANEGKILPAKTKGGGYTFRLKSL